MKETGICRCRIYFAKGAYTELSLSAANPIKLYESTGKAIGYIVNYYYNSTPYGYVIFDTTGSSLISEYSFGPNAKVHMILLHLRPKAHIH